jgi:hypothetical protein
MTKATIFLLLILSLACTQGNRIPEISLEPEVKAILPALETQNSLYLGKLEDSLIVVGENGKISRFNTVTEITDQVYQFNTAIESVVLSDNNTMLLRLADKKSHAVFDLKSMKPIVSLPDLAYDSIVGLDGRILLVFSKDKLTILDISSGKAIKEIQMEGERVFNCHTEADTLYILAETHMLKYNRVKQTLSALPLPEKAVSGFLWDQGTIFYGSVNRNLIKFSLEHKKIDWSFRLADTLSLPPERAGSYVAVTAEDNNIYFFKRNGTLFWWGKLDATRLFAPVVMHDNICVVTMPVPSPGLKFFDFKAKTITSYSLNHQIICPPVHINSYVYLLGLEPPGQSAPGSQANITDRALTKMVKLGNRYTVDITTVPENILAAGKSIRFELKPVNLQKPELTVQITDGDAQQVFEKNFHPKDDLNFLWIPEKEGQYNVTIKVKSENRGLLDITKALPVINLENTIRKYYFDILEKCQNDIFQGSAGKNE